MTGAETRRVLVIGLAETGVAVARALRAEGWEVTVVEDTPSRTPAYATRVEAMRAVGAELVEAPTDARVVALVARTDLVVPSPLVRPGHVAITAARTGGIVVRSEIDLAAERAQASIVAVTGTNGKTTVTTMVAAMLDASGVQTIAAGNIGRPLLDAVAADAEVIVAEVSSFQLVFAGDAFRPRVAVLLAITPDHLDWHGSFDDYAAAKARIAMHQTEDDLLVFDADDERAAAIAARAPARRVGVSGRAAAAGCFRVVDDELVFPDGRPLAPVGVMARALAHDRTNALAAAAAALEVGATVDGMCLDAEGAVWAACPFTGRVLRLREGGEVVDEVKGTHPGAFACMLGGGDRRTLYLCTAPTHVPEEARAAHGGRIEAVAVEVPGAGRP